MLDTHYILCYHGGDMDTLTNYQRLLQELTKYEKMINAARVMKLEVNCGPTKAKASTDLVVVIREYQVK